MNDRISLAPERSGRIYIAGPMTGLPDFNFPAFNDMAAILRGLGYHVENPAEHGVVEGAEWGDYLRYDIARLATCEALVLLPGWRDSRGALLEVHIAKALGIQIMFAEVFSRFDHERIVAALTRPAQTAPQPEQSGLGDYVLMPKKCPSWLEDVYDACCDEELGEGALYLPAYEAMAAALARPAKPTRCLCDGHGYREE